MPFSETTDDKLLWQAFKQGDKGAFSLLYQRYIRVLLSYGNKISQDEQAVEDAVQDLFVDLWQSRRRLSDVESARFYLFRSLRRKIHQSIRPDQSLSENWESTDEAFLPISPAQETELINAETIQLQTTDLQGKMKSLPLRQYEVLMLYYYQGFNYAQIASILAINEQSVRNLLQRGLHKLRQLAHLGSILFVLLFFLLEVS
ncbi:RNA polymerase sigma factor [Spirosoma endbachense]|uniref:Sigma-70 family RNA polymerase sigma factor n=1 Tax=Spirosoma endbachense TaxID=2666025 RepID=A0A6P1W999_9BACT|nr:sigma-70 family RNA polymerase sigma factor [Spirosoma endbachense]QHW00277.1 sigma-70 family RNA polymerase sigma factor [Spirosoma endbachense]